MGMTQSIMNLNLNFVLVLTFLGSFSPIFVHGHGTVSDPVSRVRSIYLEGPDSPDSVAAQAAIAHAGANQYYTWNQLSQNVANYNDSVFDTSYASVIPDGKLASGNNVGPTGLNFSGMDLVSNAWDWPATQMTAGAYTINWLATAPHDPSFFKVWITKADYNHKTPLAWGKMEFLGKFNQTQYTKDGLNYKIPVTIPTRTGRHVLYVAWQRIDPVGEVFFSTSDIIFGGGGGDPDADPLISVGDVAVNENAGTASISVTLDKPVETGKTASVSYTTANGTATDSEDYTATSGALNFAEGEASKTISVAIINDSLPETKELFTVTLSSFTGVTEGDPSAVITINDDDVSAQAGYDFAKRDDWGGGYNGWLTVNNAASTAINNGTLVVTVPSGQTLAVFGGIVATDNGDGTYTVSNINIPANGSILLDLGFNNATGGTRGPTQVTLNGGEINILPPSVSIADVSKAEGDTSGMVNLTVTLNRAHTASIHVSYQTIDGTAVAPSDYTAKSGNLEFTAGQVSKVITISHSGNTINEADKKFAVALAGVNGEDPPLFSADGNIATITLTNDDGPINFTATGGTVIEGDSGTRTIIFRMFLDRAVKSDETVSVDYMAHGHGATLGSDFSPTMGTYVFPAGATTGTIEVPVIGDTLDERHEWFNVHFTSPAGVSLISTHATGQIIDDEFDRSQLGKQRVVAYLDGTSGNLKVPPADRVTHIMYAFANLNADGTLNIGASVPGHLATLTALKSQNPDLKVLISVGGWTWSANFSAVAADPAKRAVFANSCVQVVKLNGLDGIDVDWEWPGVSGGPGTTPTPQDGANYTLLLQALRTALDIEASQTPNKHYEISAFTAAGPSGIAALELNALSSIFDFVNAQGYDLHGPWNGRAGHNAGLYHNSADPQDNRLNIDSVLAQYLAGGFKRSQLLIGAPFYARIFYDVGTTANGLFQPSSTTGGTKLYRDMTTDLQNTQRHWDAYAKVPYLYNPVSKIWSSYDDPQAMHEKALYSLNGGYGGVYFWRNGGDTNDRQLLTTISDSLSKVDSDDDGIDDAWETSNFGDLTTAHATSDNDGDGMTDLDEFASNTNPLDSTEYMKILSITSDNSAGNTLRFPSQLGVRYRLQTSTTLDPNSWTDVGEVIEGTGQEISITDNTHIPLGVRRFYRVSGEAR